MNLRNGQAPPARRPATVSLLDSNLSNFDNRYDDLATESGWYNLDEGITPKVRAGKVKKKPAAVAKSLSDAMSEQGGDELAMTYHPARYEAIFLRESLQPFFISGVLEDVLALVKGGKEANVYLCKARPESGLGLIAAKVYRPRMFRNLRNDAMYREGRETLSGEGGIIRNRNNREMRAIQGKTDFGKELTHVSWLLHEYSTLHQLYAAGAAVPKPIAFGGNAILMEFIGTASGAAPILHSVNPQPNEAERLFHEVMRNVEVMLAHGYVHGDLSSFNVLYHQGKVTVIDFPQIAFIQANRNAYNILERDVTRICEYFALHGVEAQPKRLAGDLWRKYSKLSPGQLIVDEYRDPDEEAPPARRAPAKGAPSRPGPSRDRQ
jgi:RIO kinase 1